MTDKKKWETITRRDFVRKSGQTSIAVMALASSLPLLKACKKEEEPQTPSTPGAPATPHILLILTDQEQQMIWKRYEQQIREHLPGRAWLRDSGVEFVNAHYSTLPCSPSRASIFTGMHAHQHHVYGNCGMDGTKLQSFPTIATILQDKFGYDTCYLGKSHLSSMSQYPCSEDKSQGMTPYGFDEWPTAPNADPFEVGIWPDGVCYDSVGYPSEGTTEDEYFMLETLEWLKNNAHSSTPWFTVVSLVNPHDIMWYPYFEPDDYEDVIDERAPNFEDREDIQDYKPSAQDEYINLYNVLAGPMPFPVSDDPDAPANARWRRIHDAYLQLMKDNDVHIEAIVNTILELPDEVKDNLVLAFTADHGDLLGAHGQRGKGPCMYQEQMNVPLIFVDFSALAGIADTSQAPASGTDGDYFGNTGSKRSVLAHHHDLITTLVSLAAGPKAPEAWRKDYPHIQGANLLPVLKDASEPVMIPDWHSGDDFPSTSVEREHILATSDQNFSLPIDHETRIDVTTAPHIVCIRKQERDAKGDVIKDYKLNLHYYWHVDGADDLVLAESGKSQAYVDWENPHQVELYDMLESDLDLLETVNLVPRDLPRADANGEVDGEPLKWQHQGDQETYKNIYEELKTFLLDNCVPHEIRREIQDQDLKGLQDDAWDNYRTGESEGECDPLDIGDRHIDCVGM
jgi:arylsulfatase A-like enzyme